MKMPLEEDNPEHRAISNELDEKLGGKDWYDKAARPVIHGTYHAGRFVVSDNPEEFERAKDQLSKIGTGIQQTNFQEQYQQAHPDRIFHPSKVSTNSC